MKKFTILLLVLGVTLQAQILISPIDAMKENFGTDATITKKNILLTNAKFKEVQKNAQLKMDTKIYRTFSAKKNNLLLGYGILINRKVRSKNTVVLYMIEDEKLKSMDIIAFNEPLEYVPSETWKEQFNNTSTSKYLQLNKDIPTITGATLSARSITDGSRLAFSLYNTLLKGK
jgi:hypothetical protein